MKLSRLRLIANGVAARFRSGNGTRSPSYSTATASVQKASGVSTSRDVYRRISPFGDPDASVAPILDQWVEEGGDVRKGDLCQCIKALRHNRRYKHALQVSMWMSDKRYFSLTNQDVAIRLDLICKVHGIEQAEKFFNNVSSCFKTFEVYGSLLNCYAHVKHVEKAEAVMQTIKGLGSDTLPCNVLLKLYHQTENFDKLNALIEEMEEKGIPSDKFTYGTRLNAYAALHDVEGMDNTMQKAESDSDTILDWSFYSVAANAYILTGLFDKALALLKKCEDLMPRHNSEVYNYLLTQYAATGRKDEVLRLWEQYKERDRVYNKGYLSVMAALVKLDDVETAEKIFEDWEASNMAFDIRLPNLLLRGYAKSGLLEKAETLVNRIILEGQRPDAKTWYHLSQALLYHGEVEKAVEAMKDAILISKKGWKPAKASLVTCLELLKDEDMKRAEEFIRLLRDQNIISGDIQEWLGYMKVEKSDLGLLIDREHDALLRTGETWEPSEAQNRSMGKISEVESIMSS